MYKNRISRPNAVPTIDLHPHFFIRCANIAFDERARYVEFVCDVWNEGRFGPGRVAPVTINLSDRPEPGTAERYDLCDDGPNGQGLTPGFALSSLGRSANQSAKAAYRRAKQVGLVDTGLAWHNSQNAIAPNQGRGSP